MSLIEEHKQNPTPIPCVEDLLISASFSITMPIENHKAHIDDWFEGFRGYAHMDASQVADRLLQDPQCLCCLVQCS